MALLPESIIRSNIQKLDEVLPKPELCLELGRRLINPSATLPFLLPSRYSMAAHWGDTNEQRFQLANHIYQAAHAVQTHVGEIALIFSEGTPESVLSAKTFIEHNAKIIKGIVSFPELEHSFSGTLAQKNGKIKNGVSAPYLGIEICLPLSSQELIQADIMSSSIETIEAPKMLVPIHNATVSLSGDIQEYQDTRYAISRPMLVGNEDCKTFLDALSQRTDLKVA